MWKNLSRVLAVLLAITLVMPMYIAPDVQAVTQAEINSLKQNASSLESQKRPFSSSSRQLPQIKARPWSKRDCWRSRWT